MNRCLTISQKVGRVRIKLTYDGWSHEVLLSKANARKVSLELTHMNSKEAKVTMGGRTIPLANRDAKDFAEALASVVAGSYTVALVELP